jgi:putative serine protease PepD
VTNYDQRPQNGNNQNPSGSQGANSGTSQQPNYQQQGYPQQPTQQGAVQQPTQQQPTQQQVYQRQYQQPTQQRPAAQQNAYQQAYQQSQPVQPTTGNGGNGGAGNGGAHITPSGNGGKGKKGLGRGGALLIGIVGAVVGVLIMFGILNATGVLDTGSSSDEVDTTDSQAGQVINITTSEEDATTAEAVAAKALPSVVTVYATDETGTTGSQGSGVILDEEGDVITNYHVVEEGTTYTVSLDGNSYEAELLGSDPSSDLAVLKVDFGDTEITPIEVGDSDELVVGDWVAAIGSPYGLDQSISVGVVSSLYRSTMVESYSGNMLYTNLIQTDAAINPGNSGGALVNDQGQLVGICTLNATNDSSGSSASVGFAIPGNYAVEVANEIINDGTVQHPYLGVSAATVNAQNANSAGLSVDQGAYVTEVVDGSPAADAGIEVGDVITAIDDEQISSAEGLILAVRSHEIGDEVTITLMRGDEEIQVTATLGSDEGTTDTSESNVNQQSSSGGGGYSYGYGYGNGANVSGTSSDGDYTYTASSTAYDEEESLAA